ncbi:hypothetical protein IBB99_RS22300 [Escherichia coli]|jgi:hypothetical protein|uniref:hypothetical protein n=1 Tax=Enterobacteriaceae TaxID=543 RepID=UPI000530825D|nr:hypothetical protein [Escherichia coli]EGD2135841.1 hypothetical protein [Escherichia coli]EKK6573935.1 hypothetical protein [Salmonella enterica]HEG1970055.1 hypothetical protein [Escherichia coli]
MNGGSSADITSALSLFMISMPVVTGVISYLSLSMCISNYSQAKFLQDFLNKKFVFSTSDDVFSPDNPNTRKFYCKKRKYSLVTACASFIAFCGFIALFVANMIESGDYRSAILALSSFVLFFCIECLFGAIGSLKVNNEFSEDAKKELSEDGYNKINKLFLKKQSRFYKAMLFFSVVGIVISGISIIKFFG